MLLDAIHLDLGKPRVEVMVADMGPVVSFVVEAIEKLEEWAAPESVDDVPAYQSNWSPMKYKMPKGKVLLISYVLRFELPVLGQANAPRKDLGTTLTLFLSSLWPALLPLGARSCSSHPSTHQLSHKRSRISFRGISTQTPFL